MHSESQARMLALLGEEKTKMLEDAHVVVVGIGGVGGSCALALARAFVGRITVIDADVVEPSNINRQALAFESTVGKDKVEVFKTMAMDINPSCRVDYRKVFLTRENLDEVMNTIDEIDYIIDAIDTMSAKVALIKWAKQNNINIVCAMGAARHFDPTKLEFADIYKTSNCSVSKVIRKECRKAHIDSLEVLYSSEIPVQGAQADVLGSISYLPPVMGEMLAGYVICKVTQIKW